MAFSTGFTLRAELRAHSPQGASCLAVEIFYELDSEDEDVPLCVEEKMHELEVAQEALHQQLTRTSRGEEFLTRLVSYKEPETKKMEPIMPACTLKDADSVQSEAESEVKAIAESAMSNIEHGHGPAEVPRAVGPSALQQAEENATTDQVRRIREALEKDNVSDEDFEADLQRRFQKSCPEDLSRLQASTILFEMKRREDFRRRELTGPKGR